MTPRSKKATKKELERYAKLKELGCIVTRLKRGVWAYPEIHHMTSGGRRLGNEFTLPLTSYYHRGVLPPECKNSTAAQEIYGPSFAKSRKQFEATFGDEETLLRMTNEILAKM